MFTALERLAKMTGDELPVKVFAGKIPPLEDQEKILDYLKNRKNH
jgi:hypothetical protein